MSASLVGSEMCIRDRSNARRDLEHFPASPKHRLEHLPARSAGAATLRPVSYTHLTLPTICSV
eukprot:2107187-Alexandrium_andersonii.AAC.1